MPPAPVAWPEIYAARSGLNVIPMVSAVTGSRTGGTSPLEPVALCQSGL